MSVAGLEQSAAQETVGQTPTLGSPAAIAGIRHYSPGTWSVVSVDVYNSSDEPVEVLAATFFKGYQRLQFGRKLWLPPHARRRVWYPVRPPVEVPDKPGTPLEVETMLYDRTGGKNELIKSRSGQVSRDAMLSVGEDQPVTAILRDDRLDDDAHEAVIAARTGKGFSRRVSEISDLFLPAGATGLEGLEQLVICSDRIATDAAGLAAVRRWLHNGGRLWLMLDEVSEETVALLLEDAYECEVVDEVELTRLVVEGAGGEYGTAAFEPREFERPVRHVRVLTSGVEDVFRVNGWPAAFFQTVGQGDVLFTTLSAHAWMRAREASDPDPRDPSQGSSYLALPTLRRLADRFLTSPAPATLTVRDYSPLVTQRVGYEVTNRSVVLAWLGGFCLVLLIAGIALLRRDRLERMGWVTPLAAGVASLGLATVGAQSRDAAQPALSVMQRARLVSGSQEVQLTGLAALYQRERTDAPLESKSGALLWPDMRGLEGDVRRMVWTDLDTWHWENLSLPAGLRLAEFDYATRVARSPRASVTLGESGLSGEFTQGLFENVSDAVLGTTSGRWMSIAVDSEGRLTADADDVLAPGQFLSGALLSDEQRRRQAGYALHFPPGVESNLVSEPTLFAWADAVSLGVELPAETKLVGSALLSIPLTLNRPEPGSRITIPSFFLRVQPTTGPESARGSQSTFNHRTGTWMDSLRPALTWLRFEIPGVLRPLELTRGVVAMKAHAPGRRVRLQTLIGGEVVTLAERESPVGTFHFDFDNVGAFDLDAEGGLLIGIDVGGFGGAGAQAVEPGDPATTFSDTWTMDYVRLDLQGTVPER